MSSAPYDSQTTSDTELSGVVLLLAILAINALLVWLCT